MWNEVLVVVVVVVGIFFYIPINDLSQYIYMILYILKDTIIYFICFQESLLKDSCDIFLALGKYKINRLDT